MKNLLYYAILVLCLAALIPGTSQAEIKDGLISVWSLDEGVGIYTEDQAGSNHGLLLQGSSSSALPTWITPGKLGNSHLEFTSGTWWTGPEPHGVLINSDHTVESGAIPLDLMPTTAVSVSAWVKAKEFIYYGAVFFNATWTSGIDQLSGFMMHTYDGMYNWWLKPEGGNYGIITYAANTDQWYHLVGTYDNSLTKDQLKFYVNGVLEGKVRVSGQIDWDPVPYNCLIGAYNDENENHEFLGEIEDVAIWNRALTQEEISWIYNNGIGNAIPGQPLIPTPPNRAELVDCEQDLSWELAWDDITVLGYDAYFGTDPNEENPTWYGNNKVVDNQLVTMYDPGELAKNTTYYWRVDIIEPNDLGGTWTRTGRTWQFTTCPLEVVILQQPQEQVLPAGSSAVLSVEALNVSSYQWYKEGEPDVLLVSDGSKIIGSQTDILTITDFQTADEGTYYCLMLDSEGVSKETDHVLIMTERLLGYWPLDGDALDASPSGVDGTLVGNVAFVDGIDGSAIELTQSDPNAPDYIILGTAEDLNIDFMDFTVSAWIKGASFSGDAAIISNKDWDDGYNTGWVLDINSGTNAMEWNIGDGTNRADYDPSGPTLNDDQWHFLCVTHDRDGNAVFYVDGDEQAQTSMAHVVGPIDAGYPTCIGTDGAEGAVWPAWFRGSIDDVRIYNYILEPLDVAQLYVSFKPDESVCLEIPEMDFDGNCRVDIDDFAAFAATWLECNTVPTCIN